MGKYQPITSGDEWFLGEDKVLEFDLVDAAGLPLNASTFALQFVVRRHVDDVNPALLVEGANITTTDSNPDDGVDDDRVLVTVRDTDTDTLLAGTYQYVLRRADDGTEQVYAHGPAVLRKAAAV